MLVAESAWRQLDKYAHNARGEFTTHSYADASGEEQFAIRSNSEEVSRQNRLASFAEELQPLIHSVGGETVLKLPTPNRGDLEEAVGATALESIAIGVERNCPIWGDDWPGAALATHEWNAKVVTTQAVLGYLKSREVIDAEEYHTYVVDMIVRGYSRVVIDRATFEYTYQTTGGDVSDPRLSRVIDLLSDVMVPDENVLVLAGEMIAYAWQMDALKVQ